MNEDPVRLFRWGVGVRPRSEGSNLRWAIAAVALVWTAACAAPSAPDPEPTRLGRFDEAAGAERLDGARAEEHSSAELLAPLAAVRAGTLSLEAVQESARLPHGTPEGAVGRLALGLALRLRGQRGAGLARWERSLVEEGHVRLGDGRTVARVADELLVTEAPLRVGDEAPDFEDPEGAAWGGALNRRRGKVVLLHFWGFW